MPGYAQFIHSKNAGASEATQKGESVSVHETSSTLSVEIYLAEKSDMGWVATFMEGESIKAVVTGTGLITLIGKIATGILKPKRPNFKSELKNTPVRYSLPQ